MSDVITLSSDEDEKPKPKKRRIHTIPVLVDLVADEEIITADITPKTTQEKPEVKQQESTDVIETKTNGNSTPEVSLVQSEAVASAEELAETSAEFEEFIHVILQCDVRVQYKELLKTKVRTLRYLYKKLPHYVEKDDFKQLVKSKIVSIKEESKNVCEAVLSIYDTLKFEYEHQDTYIPQETKRKIQKLDVTLKKLRKKIRKLETAEVDLDDEDSSYIQLQRYKERAAQVFEKFCSMINENPNYNRVLYEKLNFSKSKFPEFNKCINKKFRNNDSFPTYYDMHKTLKRCAEKHGMKLHKTDLDAEVKVCFQALGNLLQTRRREDLFSIHMGLLNEQDDDPATKDPDLSNALKEHKSNAEKKLSELVHEFVEKQEKGEEPVLSEDSDDSQRGDSGKEDDDEDASRDISLK